MLTGRKILYILIGFFGIILIANIHLVYYALKTNTGLQTQNPYVKGIQYQERLDHAKAQSTKDYKYEIELKSLHDNNKEVIIHAYNSDASPLVGQDIEIEFYRPAQEGNDMLVKFEERSSGVYYGEVELPFKGLWELRLLSSGLGLEEYRSISRVVVNE